jgi:hypothetical protein
MNLHYSLDDARDAGDAPWNDVVQDDFHVAIFKDKYPVTEGICCLCLNIRPLELSKIVLPMHLD